MYKRQILLVCEATLGNAWLDVDFLSDREGREPLANQFDAFVQDWKRAHEVDLSFKLTVADIAKPSCWDATVDGANRLGHTVYSFCRSAHS